ncbi:MAG: hypothetical protein HA494_07700 [Thaumarchaeota archaeon]|nr:hypothetical protein [Nitrososphaerota archaeon]
MERTKQNSSNTSLANVHQSTSIHRPRRCKKRTQILRTTIKALKLCGTTLKELNIEELEKRLTKLEASIGEA